VGVNDAEMLPLAVWDGVCDGVRLEVRLPDGDTVGVRVPVVVRVGVVDAVMEAEGVMDGVGVLEGVSLAVALSLDDSVADLELVPVSLDVGV